MANIIFDIETEPLPEDRLLKIYEARGGYEPPEPPGEFDESEVKLGAMKDPAKIEAKIEAKRAEHAAEVADYDQKIIEEAEAHYADFVDKASLCATTGRVLAIGILNAANDRRSIIAADDGDDSEAKALQSFWSKYKACHKAGHRLVGVNTHQFDLPFLVRRSWSLDVAVPTGLMVNGRFWNDTFVDLCEVFYCGQRMNKPSASFDALARFFGTAGKPEGVNGKDFARLWREDRKAAEEYLLNDLQQPAEWAVRMGVC